MSDKNKKIPNLTNNGEYPYVDSYQFRDGSWYRQDSTPNNENIAWGHKKGSYHEFGPDGSWKHFSTNTVHNYNQGGTSETTEGNRQTKVGGSAVTQTDGDHHTEFAGTVTSAAGEGTVTVSGGSHFSHATHGIEHATSGDIATTHEGNIHHSTDGDHIEFTSGVSYEHVGSEKGLYVQGNYDIKVDGNYQVSCKAFTITAEVVTIKTSAGDITITSSGNIKVNASGGTVEIDASGDIKTQGATTKLQGGGTSSPPVTVS